MRADCNKVALTCRICAHARRGRSNQPGLKAVVTNEPLELVCMDILDLGRSSGKNRYALVMVDHFSKWVVAEPVADKSSETVAQAFVEKFILLYGCPQRIHSDRGTEFLNQTLDGIANILKVEKSATAGYDPNANGLVERYNQIILNMLKRNIGRKHARLGFTVALLCVFN
jgi:transposase InsO family protein